MSGAAQFAAGPFADALAAQGAAAAFEHAGLIYSEGVPEACVRAYAAARLARAEAAAILSAMAWAFMGGEPFADDGRSFVWMCARAWAGRLGALERQARGMAGRAA
ncbi:MAG TPA: hypothetical protein VF474_16405 [Phenylobacterium sp.]